ncbi:MAG: response regulator [Bacteroidia bacterium]
MNNKPTIMLIDDNEVDNFINQRMIESCSFAGRIYVHSSSKSAIEFFKNFERIKDLPKSLLPSLIFLDINMPVTDGFGFAEEFNKLSKDITEGIRIVFLTSSTSHSDIAKYKVVKNTLDFINKPLTTEQLKSIELKLA